MMTLEDGVYVGLPAADYFAQDRLGSTDLKTLHNQPADWFYASRLNPNRADKSPSSEMEFGSALHALVLEGEDAYRASTVTSPYADYRTRVAQEWRESTRGRGVTIVSEDMDRRVRHMAALILNHPDFTEALTGGLSEVSVLWTHESGLKLRARFDKLLPRFVIDLKSYGGDARGITSTEVCTGLIANRHMDVQRYMYSVARNEMARLIEKDALHGATLEHAVWLKRVAAVTEWQWAWIFYRRQDDERGHAPVVKPLIRSHNDVTFKTGRKRFDTAVQNYHAFMARYGTATPWAVLEPAEEPEDHAFPVWLSNCPDPVTFPEAA